MGEEEKLTTDGWRESRAPAGAKNRRGSLNSPSRHDQPAHHVTAEEGDEEALEQQKEKGHDEEQPAPEAPAADSAQTDETN